MTDLIEPLTDGMSWDHETRRADAFRIAGRHSTRVRLLKWLMMVASAVVVALLVYIALFDPFHHLVHGFSVEGVGINGSKVTMQKPRVAGFRQDGRPYEITAASMTQDLKKPNAFDLTTVSGVIGTPDKGTATITATSGHYDNSANLIDLQGDVHVKNDSGYEAFLQTAHVDFKSSTVVTDKPVRVLMNASTIVADSMRVTDNGKSIVFDGHVKSLMMPTKAPAGTTGDRKSASIDHLKGTSP